MTRTCDELAAAWAEEWPRPDPSTNASHRVMVRRFGRDFRFRDPATIERSEARRWAMDHPGDVRYVCSMFNDYLEDGKVRFNPFSGLRLARSRGRKDLVVPTVEQIEKLIAAAEPTLLSGMIRFAAYTGIRLGEHRGIRRVDFLGEHRAFIEVQRDRYETEKPPKGREGQRFILIPPPAHGVEEYVLNLAAGDEDHLHRPWPFTLNQFKSRWKECRRRAQIWVQWHELRHFCATWFLDQGASPEDVGVQFGHENPGQLIRELYGHPDKELALGRLEALVE